MRSYLNTFNVVKFLSLLVCLIVVIILVHPGAESFQLPIFANRIQMSAVCFVVALVFSSFICLYDNHPRSWKFSIIGGGIMVITASITYSIIRQEIVLIVLPSLFCLPGSAIGGILVLHGIPKIRSDNPL